MDPVRCFDHDKDSLMTQAIVDPAELRRFAQALRRFNEELNDKSAALGSHLNTLSQTWRDQEHLKFSDEMLTNHLSHCSHTIDTVN